MPLFNGKRSARLPQVMVDPEMLELIRHRAERMNRPIGSEIVHLLTEALCRDREASVYDLLRVDTHRFARPRKAPHVNERKAGAA